MEPLRSLQSDQIQPKNNPMPQATTENASQVELLLKLQLSDPALHAMMIGNKHYFSNVPHVFTVSELPYFDDEQKIYKVRAYGYKAPRPSENTKFYFVFSELKIDPSEIVLFDKIKVLTGFPHPNNFLQYVINTGTNKGQRRTVSTQFPENGPILESLPTLTARENPIQQKPIANETRKQLLHTSS